MAVIAKDAALYAKLEDRVPRAGSGRGDRGLPRAGQGGRPLAEIARETVRVHAPYTHVPYHQRIDRGFVRFVNNDHCLLSTRASLLLPAYRRARARLPADGPDRLVRADRRSTRGTSSSASAPGHYGRRTWKGGKTPPFPSPTAHWPDQEPLRLDGPFEDRLDHWLTLVQQGEVIEAYRVFLGLFEEREQRRELLAQLAFAGPHRRAGPDALQPLLHHRPQVLPRARHHRARRRHRLGRRPRRHLRRRASTWRWARAGTRTTRWPAR